MANTSKQRKTEGAIPAATAGSTIESWCPRVPIARSTFYQLPEDIRPKSLKIGRRVLILESPDAWLKRMSERGGVPSSELTAA